MKKWERKRILWRDILAEKGAVRLVFAPKMEIFMKI